VEAVSVWQLLANLAELDLGDFRVVSWDFKEDFIDLMGVLWRM